jgi:solute carrier family 25 carnitine/acylcarnitine transporter 20/29
MYQMFLSYPRSTNYFFISLLLVQVRMQTSAAGSAGASGSVLGIFANTFRTEGIRGLYRGVSAPLMAVAPIFATSFWGYDMGQRLIRWTMTQGGAGTNNAGTSGSQMELNLTQKCIAGGLSAIPTTLITAPSERVKCLLQIQQASSASSTKYKGMLDCAAQVYKSGGIKSLYRGSMATLLRDIPGSVAWFGMYEFAKFKMMEMQGIKDTSQLSPFAVLTAGGLAGMSCWVVSIGPDVLKSRLQTAPDGMYKGLWDVYIKLIKEEGVAGLFTGIRPALIRAFPANAACFFGMEVARKLFSFMD